MTYRQMGPMGARIGAFFLDQIFLTLILCASIPYGLFPLLAVTKLMYAISTGHCYLYNPESTSYRYAVFSQAGPALLIAALVLAGAWLLCCFVTTRPREDV